MLRYRLDDLGWLEFEELVQSLLKADLGLAAQSWGGSADHGRDVYVETPLPFPDPASPAEGPFLFQIKFVQGANAAGAKWRRPLLDAVSRERERIRNRKSSSNGRWREPAYYILLTNCPLTASARKSIQDKLAEELQTSKVSARGGSDICDLLDKHPELRQAFPGILGLRDLDRLISDSVNSGILERSRMAVDEARDLLPVFVPTRTYHRAWKSLLANSFVVLDGPPEMGKTAIARTIAFAHLLSNWQVVECRNPDDLFDAFTQERRQLFVADDAFGRTEYDAELGRKWERDLSHALRLVGARHRLICTTRKHILKRALREMDLVGQSARFPNPSEVVVAADDLSAKERARILYRHSRAARLSSTQRQIVRDNAVAVVNDVHFTPERIRRLVQEVLPEVLAKADTEGTTSYAVRWEIREAIRNPTDRMRKSFRRLPSSHAWLLISLLECDYAGESDLMSRFLWLRPKSSPREFRESLDDLVGTFLKAGRGHPRWGGELIDWIHPSYRDLVIEELAGNTENRLAFLRRVSVNGVKLALSAAGGSAGTREMPLMDAQESWAVLEERCSEIVSSESADAVAALFDVLASASKAGGAFASRVTPQVFAVVGAACETLVGRWRAQEEPTASATLVSFHSAAEMLPGTPRCPIIERIWRVHSDTVRTMLDSGDLVSADEIGDWCSIVALIEKHYLEFADEELFRATRSRIQGDLLELASKLVKKGATLSDWETNESEGRRIERFADALANLGPEARLRSLVSGLHDIAQEYETEGLPEPPDDYPYADERWHPPGAFDVKALFEDL